MLVQLGESRIINFAAILSVEYFRVQLDATGESEPEEIAVVMLTAGDPINLTAPETAAFKGVLRQIEAAEQAAAQQRVMAVAPPNIRGGRN